MASGVQPLISVLIPVYNGAKYLPKAIQSLQAQTYKNFEVIFIDDLSTDTSAEIIQNVSQTDSRFKYIKREYKGGNAVKGIVYGLPYCQGDYFFFMSQDDFIDDDMFEKAIEKALETGAEVVLPDWCFYIENTPVKKASLYPLNGDYSQILPPKGAFYLSLDWQIGGFCLRKMDLVKRVGVKADYFNSCEFYFRLGYLNANKIAFCNSMFYYRKDNPNAINVGTPHYMFDVFKTDLMLFKVLVDNGYSKKQISKRLNRLIKNITHWRKDYNSNKENYTPEQRNSIVNIISECEKELLDYCIKLKDIKNLFLYFTKIIRNKIKD